MNIKFYIKLLLIYVATLAQPAEGMNGLQVGYIERPLHLYANADGTTPSLTGKRFVSLLEQARIPIDFVRTFQEHIGHYIETPGIDALIVTKTLVDKPVGCILSQSPLFPLQFYTYHLAPRPK